MTHIIFEDSHDSSWNRYLEGGLADLRHPLPVRLAADGALPKVHHVLGQGPRLVAENVSYLKKEAATTTSTKEEYIGGGGPITKHTELWIATLLEFESKGSSQDALSDGHKPVCSVICLSTYTAIGNDRDDSPGQGLR